MNRKHTLGLTLVELVITIAVAGILAGLAIPSFRDMIQNNRMASHANELVSSLNLARSEAVKRGTKVKIIATGNSSTNEWGEGWTVWIDTDGNGAIDDGESKLKVSAGFSAEMVLNSVGDYSLYVFGSDGSFRANDSSGVAETLQLCDTGRVGETGRQLNIAPSGRISVLEYSCS